MSLRAVIRLLGERAFIDARLLNGPGFERLVRERMDAVAVPDVPAYAAYLSTHRTELDGLVGRIAVPETWLFRYPKAFEDLVERLRRRAPGARVSILSVGCATGQEVFSIAAAALHAGCDPATTRVLGLDRRPELIAIADDGTLHEPTRRDPIPAWAARWFRREGSRCTVDPALRALVRFECMDVLAQPLPEGPWSAIFCRNVLIYLGEEGRRRLLGRVVEALEPGGTLYLGHADRAEEPGQALPEPLRRVGGPQTFAFAVGTAAEASGAEMEVIRAAPRPTAPARDRITTSSRRREPAHAVTPARAPLAAAASARPIDLAGAQRLADEGRLEDAAAALAGIIAREGRSAGTAELLGVLALSRRDLLAARRHLEEAVYLEPRRASALTHLALLLEALGDARRSAVMHARARRAGGAETQA